MYIYICIYTYKTHVSCVNPTKALVNPLLYKIRTGICNGIVLCTCMHMNLSVDISFHVSISIAFNVNIGMSISLKIAVNSMNCSSSGS